MPPPSDRPTLPVVTGTLGDPAFDIGKLNKETGYFTYDPGFMSTASRASAVTFIDGDNGRAALSRLSDRAAGQAIELSRSRLPADQRRVAGAGQFSAFEDEVTHHTMMHEALKNFLHGFHYDAHPMAMLCAVGRFAVGVLSRHARHQRSGAAPLAAIRLIAKMPTMAAAAYRYSIGWPIRYPRNNLEYVTRFLHMMFEVPSEPLQLSPVAAKALDLLFILHADHEQNASTSTVRLVGSTGANPYACVAAGIAALWGRRTAARTKPC